MKLCLGVGSKEGKGRISFALIYHDVTKTLSQSMQEKGSGTSKD